LDASSATLSPALPTGPLEVFLVLVRDLAARVAFPRLELARPREVPFRLREPCAREVPRPELLERLVLPALLVVVLLRLVVDRVV
jgi:hypothetical protein